MVKTKICKYVAVTPRFTVEGTTGKWVVGSSVKPCAVYMANVFLPQVSQERRQQIKRNGVVRLIKFEGLFKCIIQPHQHMAV